jgi:hypothetical protein
VVFFFNTSIFPCAIMAHKIHFYIWMEQEVWIHFLKIKCSFMNMYLNNGMDLQNLWFLTIKTSNIRVKLTLIWKFNMLLEISFQRLQHFICKHLNQSKHKRFMRSQNNEIHNLLILEFPFWNLGNLCDFNVVFIAINKVHQREESKDSCQV